LPNPWSNCPRLPRGAAAVLAALHFSEPRPEALSGLSEAEWRQALDFSDRSQLTLALRQAARERFPRPVGDRTDADAAKNLVRLAAIRQLYADLSGLLARAGVEFVALKGITQCAFTGMRPEDRVQYDVDLYCPQQTVYAARDALAEWGLESIEGMEDSPTDHLPALIRKTGWEWRGDFFDTEIPMAVELHFQFWNAALDLLDAPGVEGFWSRRVAAGRALAREAEDWRRISGAIGRQPLPDGAPAGPGSDGSRAELPLLCPPDALGYAALHTLRHVLHGNLRPFHVYELALFLERRARDEAFWQGWRDLHAAGLRRLEAAAFGLAEEWFGCALGAAAREEIERLPEGAKAWFDEFAASPATRVFQANKDELWLHLSLLERGSDRWRVARRRLFPPRLPGPVDGHYVPAGQMTVGRRVRRQLRYAAYVATRLRHHAVTLPQVALTAVRWKWRTGSLGPQFWNFLGAAALFNFALFIFVLLYNLRLLELGYRESFLGVVTSASTAGTVLGTLPAAWVGRRLGLRASLLGAVSACAVLAALRSLATARAPLAGLAFVWGLAFALWAVIFTPLIAGAVDEKRRPAAFSVFFACMFAVGIAGDWVGGRLPLWMGGKQPALLLAAGLILLALLPASRLRATGAATDTATGAATGAATGTATGAATGTAIGAATGAVRIYPRSAFLFRYLAAFAVWNLATGSFNPFANAYFARRHMPVRQIGNIFSASQLVQVGALLTAPVIFRRAGLVGGIVWMMLATGLALGGLAAQPGGMALPLAYMAYMSFQWMSEPGLSTVLMNHLQERERGGGAALNYLVAFSAQALASFTAGAAMDRFGYPAVLACAAGLAGVAAGMFKALVGRPAQAPAIGAPGR